MIYSGIVGSEKSVETCRYFLLSYFFFTAISSRREAVIGACATLTEISFAHDIIVSFSNPVYSNKIGGLINRIYVSDRKPKLKVMSNKQCSPEKLLCRLTFYHLLVRILGDLMPRPMQMRR